MPTIRGEYITSDSECFKEYKGYKREGIDDRIAGILENNVRMSRGDILMMTTVAGSGHPGGSLSSIYLITGVYTFSFNNPSKMNDDERDRILMSNAHCAPALYSVLGRNLYFSIDLFPSLRILGSILQGHVDAMVPGVERGFGGLGQGLSAGLADACACKLKHLDYITFVLMSDGEQTEGQVDEARDAANKFYNEGRLGKLIALIDRNHLQISGRTEDVMNIDIKGKYKTSGWHVVEVDGHDFKELYLGVKECLEYAKPSVIIAETTMGKGVKFMENDEYWHGNSLPVEKCREALKELNIEDRLDWYFERRKEFEKNVIRG